MPETHAHATAGRAYSGLLQVSNRLVYNDESSCLGIHIREAPASRILEAGASRAAFPSRSLGTSVNQGIIPNFKTRRLQTIQDCSLDRIQVGFDRYRLGVGALLDGNIGVLDAVAGQGTDNRAAFRDLAGSYITQGTG